MGAVLVVRIGRNDHPRLAVFGDDGHIKTPHKDIRQIRAPGHDHEFHLLGHFIGGVDLKAQIVVADFLKMPGHPVGLPVLDHGVLFHSDLESHLLFIDGKGPRRVQVGVPLIDAGCFGTDRAGASGPKRRNSQAEQKHFLHRNLFHLCMPPHKNWPVYRRHGVGVYQ